MLNCPIYCKGFKHTPRQRVIHFSKSSPLVFIANTVRLGIVIFVAAFVVSSTVMLPYFAGIIHPGLSQHSVIQTQVLAAHIVSPLPRQANIHKLTPTPTIAYKKLAMTITPSPKPTATLTIKNSKKTVTLTTTTSLTNATQNPTNTPAQPTTTPMQTASTSNSSDAVQQLLKLINDSRSAHGAPALSLSDKISNCALSHSHAMADRHGLFHDLATDACDSSYHAFAENVGMSTEQQSAAVVTIHNSMMNEGPGGGHYENIINATYKVVGIGIYFDGTTTWITEDFEG